MHFWKLAVIALACGCVSHASAADNSSALQGTLNSYLTATTTTASRSARRPLPSHPRWSCRLLS